MAWDKIDKAPLKKGGKITTPDGLWHHCKSCREVLFYKDFAANQNVCWHCNYHFAIAPEDRLQHFLDPNSFKEFGSELRSKDMLNFTDSKPYPTRLQQCEERTGQSSGFLCGHGKLHECAVVVGAFDFRFLGGSMGSVVGEKIVRVFREALAQKAPAIIFSSSGGARMQEGIHSLMQMAKTCGVLSQLRDAGIPFISVMTNPTTGGVAASFAMLGDVNIGEHGALIGFAGPRVIQQTVGEQLPKGFQTADYLLDHGMLDLIAQRGAMRDEIGSIIEILYGGMYLKKTKRKRKSQAK